ncbi:MAG: SPFH domain-containing protein [Pseudomonadota bacterium]
MYIIFLAIIVVCLFDSFFTVQQGHERLVTRFGKLVGTARRPGLQLKLPFIDRPTRPVSTQLQQVKDKLATKTSDNIFVELPISIQFEISDTAQFLFANDNPIAQIQALVNAGVRTYTSDKDFQHLYSDRDQISELVITNIHDSIGNYGVHLRRIVIDEPHAPMEIQQAYNQVRASERAMEAAKNEAQAGYIRRIKEAEADKQRNILIGEGVAGFRQRIADNYVAMAARFREAGVTPQEATEIMTKTMYLDTIRDIGDKGNMVIVVPETANANSITAPLIGNLAAKKA